MRSFIAALYNTADARLKRMSLSGQRSDAIVKQLTLEEKIALLHANSIFTTAGVSRLGIPGQVTDDGPLGIREDVKGGWGPANLLRTLLPFSLTDRHGATGILNWPIVTEHDMGEKPMPVGRHNPCTAFNITRTRLCGRTYEYYSETLF